VKGTPLHRSLGLILGCALVAAIFLTSLGERRVDLWWQLAQGLSIFATHHLPDAAPAAFGWPSQPFVDEYSLYEIALALLDQVGGLGAIHLAFIAVYLSIFAIPLLAARLVRCDLISALLLALAAIFMINRYEQRPELVGVLLLVILVARLQRTREFTPGFLLRIALLFAIWTNVHSSYVIGLMTLVLWLGDRVIAAKPTARRSLSQAAITLATAGGAVLINPYGPGRIAFTFAEENDLGSNLLSREMWPAWDQPAGMIVLLILTGLVLVLAAARRPWPARWLLALAGALYLLTVLHIRHMGFLAVPLLFLCAGRVRVPAAARWSMLQALALGLGCIAVLLFDAVAVKNALANLTTGNVLTDRGFCPGLFHNLAPGAVLCHDAEGSFLSFREPGLFPLIDSGQGRFNDATKRFYFFTVQDPHAFDQALDDLSGVDDVVVTRPVEGWTLALLRRPGWLLAGCDPQGFRFHRFLPGPRIVPARLGFPIYFIPREHAGAFRDQALAEGDIIHAFCFSALIDPPDQSLALLDRSQPGAWSEPFFSFTRAWIRTLSPFEVAPFLRAHPQPANPLLREIILARSGPAQPLPPPGTSQLERLARILTLLERSDLAGARALFSTLHPPLVSPLYYALRDQLDPAAARKATPAERWQDWNVGGEALFNQVGPQLNARAAAKVLTATLGDQ
jgi:hypothetical protein